MITTNKSRIIPLSDRWAIQFQKNSAYDEESILFIDRKYAKHDGGDWDEGQPTYSYFVSTIAEHKEGVPLCLDMSVPAWTVPADVMTTIVRFLKAVYLNNYVEFIG